MQRREFIANTSGVLGIGVLLELLQSCAQNGVSPKPTANFTVDLTASANKALNTIGGFILDQGIYIICTAKSTYIALSSICTHAGCTVNYSGSSKQFTCPCHGGVYNSTGQVVSGPPPSALAQYKVTLSGTTLTISG